MLKTAVVIPTHNAKQDVTRLLNSLAKQEGAFDVVVVDSTSTDGTSEVVKKHPVVHAHLEVDSSHFNHGGTRQWVVNQYPSYELYVFLTQDAYPVNRHTISQLVQVFEDQFVGAACGRQLPHLDATLLAAHARWFNYGEESIIKDMSDVPRLGIKVPFVSNSFSAYRASALADAGGFPDNVILSEDMYVAAKMALKGWKIAYAAQACVYHSHNYTLLEEWRRYFDIGVFHAQQPWIRQQFGGAGGEGVRYVYSELSYLKSKPYLWLPSLLRNFGKLVAYKLGQKQDVLPLSLKKKLSMQPKYWD